MKFCYINVTLAAGLIGVFDLSTSIVAINLLAREFLTNEQRLIVFDDVKIFLGLSWANIPASGNPQNKHDDTRIFVCLMVYSTFYLFCSLILILGTISKIKNYTLPWLTLEIISLANQASALILCFFRYRCENYENHETTASFPLASFYLLLSVYFWTIVFTAQESWPESSTDSSTESNDARSHVIDTDSLISKWTMTVDNRTSSESPKPPISAKYYPL